MTRVARPSGHPHAQLWLAIWRQGRMSWISLAGLIAMISGLFIAIALQNAQPALIAARPAMKTVLPATLMLCLMGAVGAGYLGYGWLRLQRVGLARLQPGMEATARRAAWAQFGLLWLVTALPAAVVVLVLRRAADTSPSFWLLLIPALGLPALAVSLGLAASTLGSLASWAIVGSIILLPQLRYLDWLVLPPELLQTALTALGLIGLPTLAWVLRMTHRRLWAAGASGHRVMDWAQWLQTRVLPSPTPRGLEGLWGLGLPGQDTGLRSGRALFLLLLLPSIALMLLFVNPAGLPWSGQTALLLGGWILILGDPTPNSWASPRLGLLPGGWHRRQSGSLFLLQRLWPWLWSVRALMATFVVLLLIAALWQPPWTQWAALIPGVLAFRVLSGCAALAVLPVTQTALARIVLVLGADLVLMGVLGLMVHADWPLADDAPLSWLARSGALLAVAVALGWLLLVVSRRTWERLDWGRQPALPTFQMRA